MTFDPNVPNAAQSPGVFPAQNNTNFARLKTIINEDHVFNDTAAVTDGAHRQVTLLTHAIAVPGDLPAGTNGMAYAWVDADGQTQLRFYNGTTDTQLTPNTSSPTKVTGQEVLAANTTSGTIYTIPANAFGTIFVNYLGPVNANKYNYYGFFNSNNGFVDTFTIASESSSGNPTISISGANIRVRNNKSAAKTVNYYIIVESIP